MYLARAIHAANALLSKSDSLISKAIEAFQVASHSQNLTPNSQRPFGQHEHQNSRVKSSYNHMTDDRKAVIHTVDVSWDRSKHAQQIVKGFRRGMYANDISFHVGDISDWIEQQLSDRGLGPYDNEFLSHIVLDMPSSSKHIEKAASVLHTAGSLLAFNPSITQIVSIVKIINQLRLPLVLDSVLELGTNTGGRDWDIRTVVPRVLTKKAEAPVREDNASRSTEKDLDKDAIGDASESNTTGGDNQSIHNQLSGMEIICRPKVGYRVAGGGFLGVWKKMKH